MAEPTPQPALYLLATLPPEPVLADVWALKQEVHRRTGSRNAVRLPPHITLIPPFRLVPADFEPRALPVLADFAAAQPPVQVRLRDFDWFGDRTLFVRVVEAEALQQLHAALQARCRAALPEVPRETRPFTPHMTLATRDLPPAQVPELKANFAARRYAATFLVTTLTLFRHDGRQWQPRQEFPLGGG
ncbi:2'-5' RNA ligase family protein [Hymenobacter gummosus]|uniref:2'-5' RNA ligase family protein n=1 Tax=Hymenobacter gummosus TaxID=1776032 RepID=A0A3S0K826_9BACT|nr:2'-5' RNA ligase family protein [Hymenobacter gummosus]RTQ52561.1 2'-5' RNA ligase family protein [Hymenobacter gummosus]